MLPAFSKVGKKGKLIISRTISEVSLFTSTAIQFSVLHAESMVHLRQNSKAVAPNVRKNKFLDNSIIYTNYILAHFSTVADFKQLYCINNRGKENMLSIFLKTQTRGKQPLIRAILTHSNKANRIHTQTALQGKMVLME